MTQEEAARHQNDMAAVGWDREEYDKNEHQQYSFI